MYVKYGDGNVTRGRVSLSLEDVFDEKNAPTRPHLRIQNADTPDPDAKTGVDDGECDVVVTAASDVSNEHEGLRDHFIRCCFLPTQSRLSPKELSFLRYPKLLTRNY